MAYATGLHPHIRSGFSSRFFPFAAAAGLLPAVIFRCVQYGAGQLIALAAFAGLAWLSASLGARLSGSTIKKIPSGDFLTAVLFLLFIPPPASIPAACIAFFTALFLGRAVFGSQSACPVHPAAAGYVILFLLFPAQASYSGLEEFQAFPQWAWAEWALIALAGSILILQRGFAAVNVFVFLGALAASSFIPGFEFPAPHIQAAVLTGFFLVSDFSFSPMTQRGRCLYSFLAAAGTVSALRAGWGAGPAFAVPLLAANAFSPWLDAIFHRPVFRQEGARG